MKAGFLKATLLAAMMAVTGVAQAADFTIRATANSNENDEDYDGLVVFKNWNFRIVNCFRFAIVA